MKSDPNVLAWILAALVGQVGALWCRLSTLGSLTGRGLFVLGVCALVLLAPACGHAHDVHNVPVVLRWIIGLAGLALLALWLVDRRRGGGS